MATPNPTRPDRPSLCQSCSFAPTATPKGAGRTTLSPDDYIRCSNDVAGQYRIDPDCGAPVDLWLCSDHAAEFDERIIESLDGL